MNIWWVGAEDIDFMAIGSGSVSLTGTSFRSGWARCSIAMVGEGTPGHGNQFNGGALTSAWLSARIYGNGVSAGGTTTMAMIGFGLYGTNNALVVGPVSGAVNTKMALFTIAAGTVTQIATESGNSFTQGSLLKVDMQVVNYGASATVNVYVNGVSVITFSGNVAVSGMTNFDHVYLATAPGSVSTIFYASEIVVSDSNTTTITGVQTLALTGAGSTTNWSNNTYTNVNGISYSDSSPTYENTDAVDQEYTVTTPTPTTYSVAGVQISARMAAPTGSTPGHIKLGYGSGGTGYFGSGASKAPGIGFATQSQIDQTNPITSAAFTSSDLSSLQLDIQSAA